MHLVNRTGVVAEAVIHRRVKDDSNAVDGLVRMSKGNGEKGPREILPIALVVSAGLLGNYPSLWEAGKMLSSSSLVTRPACLIWKGCSMRLQSPWDGDLRRPR